MSALIASKKRGHREDDQRNHEVAFAIQICRLVAGRAMTLREIADELGCGDRTVRRYVYALRSAGVDIIQWADVGPGESHNFEPDDPAWAYRLDPRAWGAVLALPLD